MHHLFKVCLNTGYLTTPVRLTVSVVLSAAGCQMRNKQKTQVHKHKWTHGAAHRVENDSRELICSTAQCVDFTSNMWLWGNLRMSSGLTHVCCYCSSCVSHSGKCWLCSQEALLSYGMLFIAGWRRCRTLASGRTLSWRCRCPATQWDAVAWETGLCWH